MQRYLHDFKGWRSIKKFGKAHDRFLIIDEKEFYHFGASLKDLGKKWFAFSKLDIENMNVLEVEK